MRYVVEVDKVQGVGFGHGKLQNQQEIAELEALAAANDANAQFRHGNFCCLFRNRVIHTDKQTAETKTWVEYHGHKHNVTVSFLVNS